MQSEDAPPVIRRIHKRVTEANPLRGRVETTIGGRPAVVEHEPDTELRGTELILLLEEQQFSFCSSGPAAGSARPSICPRSAPDRVARRRRLAAQGEVRRQNENCCWKRGRGVPRTRGVLPYAAGVWYEPVSVKVGYEISFNRYFYKPAAMRTLAEIRADTIALENETEGLLNEVLAMSGPKRKEAPKLYLVRAGRNGEDEDLVLENSLAIIGFREIEPPLDGLQDYDAVVKCVNDAFPDAKPKQLGNFTGQLWTFAVAMQEGDLVVLPRKLHLADCHRQSERTLRVQGSELRAEAYPSRAVAGNGNPEDDVQAGPSALVRRLHDGVQRLAERRCPARCSGSRRGTRPGLGNAGGDEGEGVAGD